jgi:hypothetical protein
MELLLNSESWLNWSIDRLDRVFFLQRIKCLLKKSITWPLVFVDNFTLTVSTCLTNVLAIQILWFVFVFWDFCFQDVPRPSGYIYWDAMELIFALKSHFGDLSGLFLSQAQFHECQPHSVTQVTLSGELSFYSIPSVNSTQSTVKSHRLQFGLQVILYAESSRHSAAQKFG